jgi:hypothetical protein
MSWACGAVQDGLPGQFVSESQLAIPRLKDNHAQAFIDGFHTRRNERVEQPRLDADSSRGLGFQRPLGGRDSGGTRRKGTKNGEGTFSTRLAITSLT